MLEYEAKSVFKSHWLHVGRLDQVAKPNSFFTGKFLGMPYIVSRNAGGELRAMWNVCSHHAAIVCSEPEGIATQFTCPYHGWCYRNDGRLAKATRITGIKGFKPREQGLKPLAVDTVGPFVFLRFGDAQHSAYSGPTAGVAADGAAVTGTEAKACDSAAAAPLVGAPPRELFAETLVSALTDFGRLDRLEFVKRVEYPIECNWKGSVSPNSIHRFVWMPVPVNSNPPPSKR